MKAALIVNPVGLDREKNLRRILEMSLAAVKSNAQLLLFPEAALTGLINNDDPIHDLPLGETIPGYAIERLTAFSRQQGVWLGLGILERENAVLYDSAVLFDPAGSVCLQYRRNQPQWHGRKADSTIYREGSRIAKASTPFGSVAFLICGDLFDDTVLCKFRDLEPDWLLFPFARCFSDASVDQDRWDNEELPLYLSRVKMAGVPALMVNYLAADLPEDKSFGGAFFVSAQGEVIASLPLGQEGCLSFDMGKSSNKADASDGK